MKARIITYQATKAFPQTRRFLCEAFIRPGATGGAKFLTGKDHQFASREELVALAESLGYKVLKGR